jgi:hypothetical protein
VDVSSVQQQSDEMKNKVASSPDQLDVDPEKQSEIVLSVLEEDQLVVAKERSHLGPRLLTPAVKILLWALRLYVIAMLILVAIQVLNAVHSGAH